MDQSINQSNHRKKPLLEELFCTSDLGCYRSIWTIHKRLATTYCRVLSVRHVGHVADCVVLMGLEIWGFEKGGFKALELGGLEIWIRGVWRRGGTKDSKGFF